MRSNSDIISSNKLKFSGSTIRNLKEISSLNDDKRTPFKSLDIMNQKWKLGSDKIKLKNDWMFQQTNRQQQYQTSSEIIQLKQQNNQQFESMQNGGEISKFNQKQKLVNQKLKQDKNFKEDLKYSTHNLLQRQTKNSKFIYYSVFSLFVMVLFLVIFVEIFYFLPQMKNYNNKKTP